MTFVCFVLQNYYIVLVTGCTYRALHEIFVQCKHCTGSKYAIKLLNHRNMETCLESKFSLICILWVVASHVPSHNDGQAWRLVQWKWEEQNWSALRKLIPLLLSLPQLPHALSWDWTQASTMKNQQLNTWTVASPLASTVLSPPHRCLCVWDGFHCISSKILQQAAWSPYLQFHLYVEST